MADIRSFKERLTRSARGELFNPLIYPFLLCTISYGLGFTLFSGTNAVSKSSLFTAMVSISPPLTLIWGILAITAIAVGFYVLVMDRPPIGKANCLVAWSLWLFASIMCIMTSNWLTLFAVTLPSLYFWTWQYFSLAHFRQQDEDDSL